MVIRIHYKVQILVILALAKALSNCLKPDSTFYTKLEGKTKYSAAGASSCSTVSDGYYTTGCDSSNNKCTSQSRCRPKYFCIDFLSETFLL